MALNITKFCIECQYTKYHYVECRVLFIVILNVVILSVNILIVIILNAITPDVMAPLMGLGAEFSPSICQLLY
jgi:hypothetical protein